MSSSPVPGDVVPVPRPLPSRDAAALSVFLCPVCDTETEEPCGGTLREHDGVSVTFTPCGHTVCKECSEVEGLHACMICRAPIEATHSNVTVSHAAEVEFVTAATASWAGRTPLSCADCGASSLRARKELPVTHVCTTDECNNRPVCAPHAQWHVSIGHDVIAATPSHVVLDTRCGHTNVITDMCRACHIVGCVRCMRDDHASCGDAVVRVVDVRESITEGVTRLVGEFEAAAPECERNSHAVDAAGEAMRAGLAASLADFHRKIELCVAELRRYEQDVERRAQNSGLAKSRALRVQSRALHASSVELSAYARAGHRAVDRGDEEGLAVALAAQDLHRTVGLLTPFDGCTERPYLEVVTDAEPVLAAVQAMSVMLGTTLLAPRDSRVTGDGLESYQLRLPAVLEATFVGDDGAPDGSVREVDVGVTLRCAGDGDRTPADGDCARVVVEATGPGAFRITYTVLARWPAADLQLRVCGRRVWEEPRRVRRVGVHASHTRTLPVGATRNYGFAVSADRTQYAVCHYDNNTFTVFASDSGQQGVQVGGAGSGQLQFQTPFRMCLMPRGTVLVADISNCRLQELTMAGELDSVWPLTGVVGAGSYPLSLACHGASDTVAVGLHQGTSDRVVLLSIETKAAKGTFGPIGTADGQLGGGSVDGLCFSHDGSHLFVSERSPARISMFAVGGQFVRSFGAGVLADGHNDVAVWGGHVLAADAGNNVVRVWDVETGEQEPAIVGSGLTDGPFAAPTAIAVVDDTLFVLDSGAPSLREIALQ